MAPTIKVGSVVMKSDLSFPMTASFKSEAYLPGWKLLDNSTAHSVDQIVRKAGWTFFFLAPDIRATAWGAHDMETARKAMKSILSRVKSKKFNCFEISGIETRNFLGWPYVKVCGHARHIKNSMTL